MVRQNYSNWHCTLQQHTVKKLLTHTDAPTVFHIAGWKQRLSVFSALSDGVLAIHTDSHETSAVLTYNQSQLINASTSLKHHSLIHHNDYYSTK